MGQTPQGMAMRDGNNQRGNLQAKGAQLYKLELKTLEQQMGSVSWENRDYNN